MKVPMRETKNLYHKGHISIRKQGIVDLQLAA